MPTCSQHPHLAFSHDRLQVAMHYLHQHVPLAKVMQIQAEHIDAHYLHLSAPLAPNINDKNMAFGGALTSLMALAGWAQIYLLSEWHAEQSGELSDVLIAESQVTFLKPAVEDPIRIRVAMPTFAESEAFIADLTHHGKAKLRSEVETLAAEGIAARQLGKYAARRK